MSYKTLSTLILSILVFLPAAYAQSIESFDQDPNWSSTGNYTLREDLYRDRQQDFGYSKTNFAGGSRGEIGGRIERSYKRGYFARPIKTRTYQNKMKMKGRLIISVIGTSAFTFGWFNKSDSIDWRATNFVGFRVDAQAPEINMYLETGSKSGPAASSQEGPVALTAQTKYQFELFYSPDKGEHGRLLLKIREQGAPNWTRRSLYLPGYIRQDDIEVDQFGLMNVPMPGKEVTAYLDSISQNGKEEGFGMKKPKGWVGSANRETYRDYLLNGVQRFGYDSFGQRVGGLIWRADLNEPAYYAKVLPHPLPLDREIAFDGKVQLERATTDSSTFFGYFNPQSDMGNCGVPGLFAKDMMGLFISGLSERGHLFQPAFRFTTPGIQTPDQTFNPGPVIVAGKNIYNFSFRFVPNALGGGGFDGGTVTATLNDQSSSYPVMEEDRASGALFTHFGFRVLECQGKNQTLYFDDLSWSE